MPCLICYARIAIGGALLGKASIPHPVSFPHEASCVLARPLLLLALLSLLLSLPLVSLLVLSHSLVALCPFTILIPCCAWGAIAGLGPLPPARSLSLSSVCIM